jgi:hypothetical protein
MEDRIHDFFMENLSPDKIGGPADIGVWREVEGLNDKNFKGIYYSFFFIINIFFS